MESIKWPHEWLPGLTDNFVSNEVIVKDLSFEIVLSNLLDCKKWDKYYKNSQDIEAYNQKSGILHLDSEFKFTTFGFRIEAKVLELEIDDAKKIARIAWHAWNDATGNERIEAYHAWLIEELSENRLRILTQETQIGMPAKKLASDPKYPMLNGHQDWLVGLVNYSKQK